LANIKCHGCRAMGLGRRCVSFVGNSRDERRMNTGSMRWLGPARHRALVNPDETRTSINLNDVLRFICRIKLRKSPYSMTAAGIQGDPALVAEVAPESARPRRF